MGRVILQAWAGSKSHGTDGPDSDLDVRTVYLLPTSLVLSVGKGKILVEERRGDENRWELSAFLNHGLGGSPIVFELLSGPPTVCTPEGEELRELFPRLLSKRVKGAFGSYAQGQKKLMLSQRSGRTRKAAGDYLRVLYNAIELAQKGSMTVRIVDTPVGRAVLDARAGTIGFDEVLSIGESMERLLEEAFATTTLPARPDVDAVNEYLLRVRYANA